MQDIDLLEFGIYHWLHKTSVNLPGIKSGILQSSFFEDIKIENNLVNIEESIFQFLEENIIKWEGFKIPSLILCSGGVDSSLLVAAADQNKSKYKLLHTSYVNHDNNDLDKLYNIIKKYPADINLFSIDSSKYLTGMKFLWRENFFQNTYAPTITYSLLNNDNNFASQIITGSGPDELFYGMEKYSWDFFESLSSIPVDKALEKIDVAYNIKPYKFLLNSYGLKLLKEIQNNRRKMYKKISSIYSNIFDAQRLLAYLTVSGQHMHLFNNVANFFNLEHKAPYLNEKFVKIAFSTPITLLINPHIKKDKVEIGKYHIKKFLTKFLDTKHVYSKKIGFHAPTTKFIYEKNILKLFDNLQYSRISHFLDMDKTKSLLLNRINDPTNREDYFLYSMLCLGDKDSI